MASLKERFQSQAQGRTIERRPEPQQSFLMLPVHQIQTDSDQPRKDLGNLDSLVASIKEHGVLQPLIVSPVALDSFRLIAGERRFTAAKRIGLLEVPVIARTIESHRRIEVQLVENLQRKDLNPVEEARAFERLIHEFGLNQRELGERLGKSPASVNQTLRILSLPEEILRENPDSERLSKSVLLELAKLDSPAQQLDLWRSSSNGTTTVRSARASRNKQSPPARYWYPRIQVGDAIIQVVLKRAFGTPEDLREALSAALRSVSSGPTR